MMYKAKVAVCSDIRTKRSTQSEHHVEFLNVKRYVKKPLGVERLISDIYVDRLWLMPRRTRLLAAAFEQPLSTALQLQLRWFSQCFETKRGLGECMCRVAEITTCVEERREEFELH